MKKSNKNSSVCQTLSNMRRKFSYQNRITLAIQNMQNLPGMRGNGS
jgi:hypothetical protein